MQIRTWKPKGSSNLFEVRQRKESVGTKNLRSGLLHQAAPLGFAFEANGCNEKAAWQAQLLESGRPALKSQLLHFLGESEQTFDFFFPWLYNMNFNPNIQG